MARYLDERAAVEAGYRITHEPDAQRFTLTHEGREFGEAHYRLLGDAGINFDHTVVDPELRGTGLAGVLAHHALTDAIVQGRQIQASCWFIAGYLEKHPELRD